jgi:hypothetical protein
MKDNKDVQTIENNYDNLGILKIIKYLLGVVINDIEYMNETIDVDTEDLLLGNNNYIKREDLESLTSILDTIEDIKQYNKEED